MTSTIRCLEITQLCHKITLYADYVFILLTGPETSEPSLTDVMDRFSCFSGYKINLAKSEAMPLGTLSTIPTTVPSFPFKRSPSGFVYLGIFSTPSFDRLYKANFAPFFCKIKQDLGWMDRLDVTSCFLVRMDFPGQNECVAQAIVSYPNDPYLVF